ncbi:radical SAM/SPASM domain-containing protein [Shewanella sp. UCD-KL12]|uniref:radical SAM/SPASM domain-containing protein n=1 Tax=Shewanella sp. UCD-KL12 TaxID=1917163 RepID=UPI000970F467|nr:radical SAM/SPASM domain-containing protein [Shewanella sp. UCD-KL12]
MNRVEHIKDERPASVNGADYWDKVLTQQVIEPTLFVGRPVETECKDLFRRYVSIINIEAFNFCNRKCSYCPVSFLDERRGKIQHMSDDVYQRLISELSQIDYSEKLVFNLYNEPLASKKKFYEKLTYALAHLPKARVFFNSNGDYLDLEALETLSQIGVTGINVTLHPKGIYEHLERHEELKAFYVKLKQKLVIDSENVDKSIHTHFDYKGMRIDVSCVNYEQVGHSRAGAIEHLKIETLRDYPCFRPFREFTVYHNGFVYPCCNIMPDLDEGNRLAIGSIGDGATIFELYGSKLMQSWRKDLFSFGLKRSPCDLCYERACTKDDSDKNLRDLKLSAITEIS